MWIRYYTIFLVAFDVLQIHSFAIPGVITRELWVLTSYTAFILLTTELRSHRSLYDDEDLRLVQSFKESECDLTISDMRKLIIRSECLKIAVINIVLFIISVGLFLWIMIVNAIQRKVMIDGLRQLPPRGCPSINGGSQWALWMPGAHFMLLLKPAVKLNDELMVLAAMSFEFVLFGFAVFKAFVSTSALAQINERASLISVLLSENILYFAIPFHAAMGIVTGRMIIHLLCIKFAHSWWWLEHFRDDEASEDTIPLITD
ncbi:hypothetical protein CVT25_008979 [Psilocybe cyanescens]|uniref:Uncharacterized protein n=1 Tax=Psilocybe cyanescens TaxID=93625 RepID=A0A409XN15_PSICY|nr:hypothetical protein CVT25_008979 [Psilocybe cyanescens]